MIIMYMLFRRVACRIQLCSRCIGREDGGASHKGARMADHAIPTRARVSLHPFKSLHHPARADRERELVAAAICYSIVGPIQ
jgi:hypothetical protein